MMTRVSSAIQRQIEREAADPKLAAQTERFRREIAQQREATPASPHGHELPAGAVFYPPAEQRIERG